MGEFQAHYLHEQIGKGTACKDIAEPCKAMSRRHPANKTEGPFDLTGSEWIRLTESQKAMLVEKAFRYWRRRGFPYYSLSAEQMMWELKALSRVQYRDVIRGNQIFGSNVGVTFASSFHRQMWSVRVSRYLSPMDCFRDNHCLRAVRYF